MGLISSLKRIKLKKIQPGKILVKAAKAIGGPIGGIASAAEKGVAAFNKVASNVKETASELGLTPAENAQRVAEQTAAALEGAAVATEPAVQKALADKKTLLIIGGAVVLLFLIMRQRRAA